MIYKIKTANFLPHQLKWWNLKSYIKLLVGGFGSGKTYISALRAIYLSYLNRGIPGMYVSPTYKMANKTIIPTIKEIALRSGLRMRHKISQHEFVIENWDGRFWIGSGDDPDSLRGPNLAWAQIDEPFIQSKDVFNQMLARVRHPRASHREISLTGTPEELNWGYDIAMNDDGRYDIKYVVGRTKDNKHLPKEYVQSLYNAYDENMRKAYLEGKFINLKQGLVYKPFDREKNVKHIDVKAGTIKAGIDFNVDYMTAEIFYDLGGTVHFFDEIRLANSNTFELAEILQYKYPRITVHPDASGASRKTSSNKTDHTILREMGFVVRSHYGNPAVMDRVNAVNRMIREGRLTIEPGTCPNLINDFERVVFKSGEMDKRTDPSLTHASDAAGYAIEYLYPILRREIYAKR